MKFPKRTRLAVTPQNLPMPVTGLPRHTSAKQLPRWVVNTLTASIISAAFGMLSQFLASKKSACSDIAIHHPTERNITFPPHYHNILWVKTDQLLRSFSKLIADPPQPNHHLLIGQTILCIGGRAELYTDYRRLIETVGGQLMIFRSHDHNPADHLPALLEQANVIICPVDCVNHTDFFAAKQYCQRNDKYCAVLQRSDLSTFSKAIAMLIQKNIYPGIKVDRWDLQPSQPALATLGTTGALTG